MTLQDQLERIVRLMYDTGVSLEQLDQEVTPYLSDGVRFIDPLIAGRGRKTIRDGMRGFHCAFRFDLQITQMTVSREQGRALIDAYMNLRSIPGYTYPLRTMLVYEFTTTPEGALEHITRIEEMWPIGDLVANAPLGIGALYKGLFQPISTAVALAFFRSVTALRKGRVRP